MGIQPLDSDKATVELHDGVVYLRWIRGAKVTAKDACAVMTKVSDLSSGHPRPLLVDMAGMESVEHKAREIFAAAWPLTRTAIVGASSVDRVVATFHMARHSPVCPTRFFSSFPAALTWLGGEASHVNKPRTFLTDKDALKDGIGDEALSALDANDMLNALLGRLEGALEEAQVTANGMPLFAVEAKLTERLQALLPGVRFTAQDIRAWAAESSS
ncbi:MAG TPA: hypothetical protein VFI36_09115 [Arthrobacter sp.]|nr:hypothetical protein [Arthrobacter sp.]